MKPLNAFKNVLLLIPDHKDLFKLTATLAVCWEFLLKRWELDMILLPALTILIAVNTWSGIRKAKQKGEFSASILRTKTLNKCLGYIMFLICMYVLSFMIITSIGNKETLFSVDWLHLPISFSYLFFAGVEILSTNANLKETGTKTPTFITDKIDGFVETGKINPLNDK